MLLLIALTLTQATGIEILGDLSVSGSLTSLGLSCDTFFSSGTAHTTASVTATDITATTISASEVTLSSISAQSSSLLIEADLIINLPSPAASFLQTYWHILSHESFENSVSGWQGAQLATCNERDYYIQAETKGEMWKIYKLSLNSGIKIQASVHLIDAWRGETVYMKADGEIVWSYVASSKGVDVCGGEENDAAYGMTVEAVIGNREAVEIRFGSTSEAGLIGVDDLIISLK